MFEKKYESIFKLECTKLSQAILDSLLKLSKNPKNKQELSKLIQFADTMMGSALFLHDKELEEKARNIIHSFRDVHDVRKKIEEFGIALEQFGLLVGGVGTCPKGFMLINGICVPDNRHHMKSQIKLKIQSSIV